jgi:hypothetical protein
MSKRWHCVECGRRIISFTATTDYDDRKLHKKCWRLRKTVESLRNYIGEKYVVRDNYDCHTGSRIIYENTNDKDKDNNDSDDDK